MHHVKRPQRDVAVASHDPVVTRLYCEFHQPVQQQKVSQLTRPRENFDEQYKFKEKSGSHVLLTQPELSVCSSCSGSAPPVGSPPGASALEVAPAAGGGAGRGASAGSTTGEEPRLVLQPMVQPDSRWESPDLQSRGRVVFVVEGNRRTSCLDASLGAAFILVIVS